MDNRFKTNFLKGLASTSVGSVVTIAFHFLSIILMTRYVTRESLGLYFLAVAVAQALKIMGSLGLDLTLSKFIAGIEQTQQQTATASALTIRFASVLTLGLVFYALSRLLLPIFGSGLETYGAVIVILFALTSYRDLLLSLMQGIRQFKEYAIVEIVSAMSRVALLVVFRRSLNIETLLLIEVLSQLVEIILQVYFSRAMLFDLSHRHVTAESIRAITGFSVPLYSNNLLTMLYDRSSTFLIGALLNPVSVAAFEVALKVPDGFMRLFNSFIVVYFPSVSGLFAKGSHADARRMMNRSLILISTAIAFVVLTSFLFAEEIIRLLFSQDYVEVSFAFAFLMLNFQLRAVSNILGYSLVAAGQSSAPIKANIVASLVNILGSLVLIRIFGYIGAVYALLLMNIASQVIYEALLARQGLAPRVFEHLKPLVLLAIALGIWQLFGSASYFLRFALLAVYAAACYAWIEELRSVSVITMWHTLKPKPR